MLDNNKPPYRQRTHEILAVAKNGDAASHLFDVFLLTPITLKLPAVIAESAQSLQSAYAAWFRAP
jgi:hypothetical protein